MGDCQQNFKLFIKENVRRAVLPVCLQTSKISLFMLPSKRMNILHLLGDVQVQL